MIRSKPLFKKNKTSRHYLEIYIEETGEVKFVNLNGGSIKLAEKISGKERKNQVFYCG